MKSVIGPDEIQLIRSDEHHGNWLGAIQGNNELLSPVEIGHRSCSVCLLTHISMKLGRKLEWDANNEQFIGDAEANSMLERPQRAPYGTNYVKF